MAEFPVYKTVSTAALIPYARNARTHSDAQVAKIAASIREFGFLNPIIVDGANGIIAGHGRVLAAQKLGLAELPVIEAGHLTEAQKRAYIIADNRLALDAGWDNDMLKIELQDLQGEGFNLELTGFELSEIAGFLDTNDGLTDPDAVPELQPDPVSRLGDVWVMGRHRLMCGDSTSATDVAKLMNGQSADLCFTSPPYAQQREYKTEISNWDGLMNGVFSILPVKSGAQVLVNLGLVHDSGRVNTYWDAWLDFMGSAGWPLFGWYVWDKGFGLPGNWNGRLAPAHEFIFHFSHGGNKPANKWVDKKPENIGKIKHGTGIRGKDGKMTGISSPNAGAQPTKIMDSVIRISPHMARQGSNTHPAMFPVALCDAMYKSYAKAGDWVFEPFSGSGTSIVACEQFGANCAGMELAPEYTDVAVRRWQDFTGQTAVLEDDGRTFAELEAERLAA
jgi:DNA modification methylase